MASHPVDITCVRFYKMEGINGKMNDIIYCGDQKKALRRKNVIFFGGDVQDYKEVMEACRDNHIYSHWNLDDTARRLQKKYPEHNILVVKPSRMYQSTFSVYENFVESNDYGVPKHSSGYKSWQHLIALVNTVNNYLGFASERSCLREGNQSTKSGLQDPLQQCDNNSNILIGFSKGCVVLNQLLFDLSDAKKGHKCQEFLSLCKTFIWLDGGHSGGSTTWVTQDSVLSHLQGMDILVKVHVTPYQIKDKLRVWIGKEEKKFVSKVKKLGLNVEETVHFSDDERSIENHFNILNVFK